MEAGHQPAVEVAADLPCLRLHASGTSAWARLRRRRDGRTDANLDHKSGSHDSTSRRAGHSQGMRKETGKVADMDEVYDLVAKWMKNAATPEYRALPKADREW